MPGVLLLGAAAGPITSPLMVIASYAVGVLLLAGALAVVLLRNVLFAAAALVVSFLMVAFVYLILNAGVILFLVQFFIYGGGLGVLFFFLIRWTHGQAKENTNAFNRQVVPAGIVALGVLILLGGIGVTASWPKGLSPGRVAGLGQTLMDSYPVGLATLAVLLLSAVAGGALLLRKRVAQRAAAAQPVAQRAKRRRGRADSRA